MRRATGMPIVKVASRRLGRFRSTVRTVPVGRYLDVNRSREAFGDYNGDQAVPEGAR